MEKPKRVRSKNLNVTHGPRYWREKEFIEKRKICNPLLTYKEAVDGWYRAFNKCQLAYDEKGRKYRTNIPRVLPNPDDFELRRKKGARDQWDNS